MCGIVGFIDKKGAYSQSKKLSLIRKMREKIAHRGNDSYGEYVDKNIALGHARLSFFDTSKYGAQPMKTRDNKLIISYNGEIYNHSDIRKEIRNVNFITGTDTETILYAYNKWSTQCIKHLSGMWAFALLDLKKKELFLSIDRFGIKPIYYINNDRFFAFASEIKALLVLPGMNPKLNTSALPEYLMFRSIAGRDTIFQGVYKFLPAEELIFCIDSNHLNIKRYWKLAKKQRINKNPQGELYRIINDSVKKHLIADVPVGIQLSGGVDSSMMACLAAKHKTTRLHSFSIGLQDKKLNEFVHSRVVAKKIKSIHHEILFNEEDFCKLLPLLSYHMDEPINHEHSVPMYILAKYAKSRVKALLSGEGADEVFGGYRRYELLLAKKNITKQKMISLSQFGNFEMMNKLLNINLSHSISYNSRASVLRNMPKSWNKFDKLSALDIETYLPPLLMRQDKMGMAATLENRVPFLDHELVEYAFSLSTKYKLQNNIDPWKRTKPLLKKIAENLLPHEIIYRKKVGFGLPIADWLRNENGLGQYLKLLLNSKRGLYNKKTVRKVILEHQTGIKDHTQALWILLNLELWANIFLDNKNPHTILASLRQQQ